MIIDTLHVRAAAHGPGLKSSLTHLLNSADLQPRGLAPASILIVRRMADPLPGKLSLRQTVGRVDATWEQAARRSLTDAYQRAVRPVRGAVPSAAEAVLFADEAELLACLALDMSRGQHLGRWWWQSILRGWSTPALAQFLGRQTTHLPGAFVCLRRWGQLETVVQSLSAADSLWLLSALSVSYGLTDLGQRLANWPPADIDQDKPPPGPAQPPVGAASRWTSRPGDPDPVKPPWAARRNLPAITGRLGWEQEALLGIGLLLHDNPALVRSENFMKRLGQWRQSMTWPANSSVEPSKVESAPPAGLAPFQASDVAAVEAGAQPAPGEVEPDTSPAAVDSPAVRQPRRTARPAPQDTGPGQDRRASVIQRLRAGHIAERPSGRSAQTGPVTGRQPDVQATPEDKKASPFRANLGSAANIIPAETPPVSAAGQPEPLEISALRTWLADGVSTELGGVLYLINLMRHLDLPDCFEGDWRLASQLGPWGVLELLARALLASTGETFVADPLWLALADLAGHAPDELPGAGFQSAARFVLPPAWIEPESHSFWTTELPQPDFGSRLLAGLNQDLARWLGGALPFLRFRLQQGLGGAADLIEVALTIPGELFVTASHIDLVMPLDRISLPVRRAGLDRDPGWLAGWGRVVKFHFE